MELKQVFKGAPLALIIVGITMFAMNQPGQQPKIKILTRDEDVVEVPKDLAFQSSVIKNIKDTGGDLDTPIPLLDVTAQEFNLIINILQAIKNASDQVKFKREDGKYIAQRIQPLIDTELRSTDNLPIIAQLIYAAQYLDLEQIANGAIRVLVRKALDVFPMATIASIKSIWTSNNIMWPDSLNPVLEYQYQLVKNGNIPELSVADSIASSNKFFPMPTINNGTLVLSSRGLTSVEGLYSIDGITNLRELDISSNFITRLPVGIFKDLTNLEMLKISHNNLTNLPDGIFNSLTKLQTLNISNTTLKTLPDEIFKDLRRLQYLNIDHNYLTALPVGIFNSLTDLRMLDISSNFITSLPVGIFKGITDLRILDISNNRLTTLPDGIFNSLTHLQHLNISNNSITNLPDGIFNGLTNLRRLSIKNNISLYVKLPNVFID